MSQKMALFSHGAVDLWPLHFKTGPVGQCRFDPIQSSSATGYCNAASPPLCKHCETSSCAAGLLNFYQSAVLLPTVGALKEVVRPDHSAPHVRRGTIVEAQSLRRLTEIPLDDIPELLDFDELIWIEGIEIIDNNLHGRVVPLVIRAILPFRLRMCRRLKIF